jgi:hypothetical protein
MYCPVCFDHSLVIRRSGKAFLTINGKKMDTAIFLYNLDKQTSAEIKESLEKKIEDVVKWYGSFKNPEPITEFTIHSSEFECGNSCAVPASSKISLVGSIIETDQFESILNKLAEKYKLEVDLQPEVSLL